MDLKTKHKLPLILMKAAAAVRVCQQSPYPAAKQLRVQRGRLKASDVQGVRRYV